MYRILSACAYFGRVAVLTLLLLTTTPCASAADFVRGVSPSKQALYANGIDCVPRDGAISSLATIHIPRSRINDDYCDCADGRDEPGGESACEEARFFCANAGHRSSYIPSAFVGDGTCDCCDGSDEIPGVCRDDCSFRGEAARKEAEKLAAGIMRGVRKRAGLAKEGKELVKKDQKEIDGLRRTEAALVKKVDAAKVIANRLRGARDRAEKLKNVQETALTVSAGSPEPETKDGLDLAAESGEETSFGLESSEKEENYEFDAPAVDSGYGDDAAESGKESEGNGAASPAGGEGSDAVSEDIDSDALCAELAENTSSNRLVNSAKYYQALLVTKLQRVLPPSVLPRLGVRSDAGIAGCVTKAEGQERSLRDEMTETQSSITKLESMVSLDYCSDFAMRPFHGKCIKQTFAQYEFELCNFDAIRQYERGSVIARLGSWGRWESETGTKRVMLYENGDQCWNGPKRSVRVSLECGDENEIVSVDEPNRCAYSMRFKTPAVCDAAMADAVRKVSSGDDDKYEL